MGRPRAGYSWTGFRCGGHFITLIQNDSGLWITTGQAAGWKRCSRCRRPLEASPFESGLCSTCYFYHAVNVKEFWRLHDEGYYLAPYNIGGRCMANRLNRTLLENNPRWREVLRSQAGDTPR